MANICTSMRLVGTLRTGTSITGHIKVPALLGDAYTGEYTVTPRVVEQVLPTQYKTMTDDVTVKAIPVFRVSNTSGGTTVYIANEV